MVQYMRMKYVIASVCILVASAYAAAEGDGAVRTVRDGERLKIEILKPGAAKPGEQENRGEEDEGAEA